MNYDEALQELYAAPHEEFVTERKRLATELRRSGDKPGGTRLAELKRPTLSTWAVNQLFRQAPAEFEELFASTQRVRSGELAAAAGARECTLRLKGRAASILGAAGYAVTDGTLRRITTNLSALAAAGSFEPDPPGALSADREPPGFDATALLAWSEHAPTKAAPPLKLDPPEAPSHRDGAQAPSPKQDARTERERRAQDARAERERREQEARVERERREEEARARRRAEYEGLAAALIRARADCERHREKLELLRADLRLAEVALAKAAASAEHIEHQLRQFAAEAAPSPRNTRPKR